MLKNNETPNSNRINNLRIKYLKKDVDKEKKEKDKENLGISKKRKNISNKN